MKHFSKFALIGAMLLGTASVAMAQHNADDMKPGSTTSPSGGSGGNSSNQQDNNTTKTQGGQGQ